MADQVDEVKQKTDIVSIIGERIELKKAGRNYKALCPFHSEKTASFMVSPELQMFKCFGCGEGGDVIAFLEKFEGMEFPEALKYLADRAGVKLASFRPADTSEKEKFYEINSLAGRLYNYLLLSHPIGRRALNYLTSDRGLTLEAIKTFQLGFSPDVPGALKKFLVDKKKYLPRDLERVGLVIVKEGNIFDRFRGRIIFPLFDHRGNIVGFAGRILPWQNSDLAKYINTPETTIYHKGNLLFGLNLTRDEIKKEGVAIVVEGELDMISSWQAGVKNVVAIKGSALTEDQARLISRFTKKIVFALDTDFAGDSAARRGISIAQEGGLEIKVARLGEYKDPDEAAKKDSAGYKKALGEAVGVWDFIVESIFSKADARTGEGKAKISQEVVPVLASISDKIIQAHYIDLVARKLGAPTDAVSAEVTKETSKEAETKPQVAVSFQKAVKNRRQLLEERFLTLAFQSDPKILLDREVSSLVATPLAKRILEEYQRFSQDNPAFSPSEFAEKLPSELVSGFAEMILKDTQDLVEDRDSLSKELELVRRELKITQIRHMLEVVGVKIREYEEARQRAKLKEAQIKFNHLSQKLASLEEGAGEGIILNEA